MPHVRSPGRLSQRQQLPAHVGAMGTWTMALFGASPCPAVLPCLQTISLWTPCCVTVAHMGTAHNVPIQHLRVLCSSTKYFDVLSHCHWKQCEEKAVFHHLSIADPKARWIKPCRSQQLPRMSPPHPRRNKWTSAPKWGVTFLPDLCVWVGKERTFSPVPVKTRLMHSCCVCFASP